MLKQKCHVFCCVHEVLCSITDCANNKAVLLREEKETRNSTVRLHLTQYNFISLTKDGLYCMENALVIGC